MKTLNGWRRLRGAVAVLLGRKIAVDAEFAGLVLDAATREMNLLIGLEDRPPVEVSLTKGDEWRIAPAGVVRLYRYGRLCRSILIVDDGGASPAVQQVPPRPDDGDPDHAQPGPAAPTG